jgi:hypothetical protein
MPTPIRLLPGPTYTGACDASSAVAVGNGNIIVADDEKDSLRLYRPDGTHENLKPALTKLLGLDTDEDTEVDLEGSARVGDIVYWIGSHSRNSKGKPRPVRHHLFASKMKVDDLRIELTGEPIRDLYDRLATVINLPPRDEPIDDLAQDLSIEGFAATPRGELLLGLRSPLTRKGKCARVISIGMFDELQPRKPIELDLGGRGIRSLEYWPKRDSFLILAGPPADGGDIPFSLLEWGGRRSDQPQELIQFEDLGASPECIVLHDDIGVQIVLDEGDSGSPPCKKRPRNDQRFRSFWVDGLS